MQAQSQPPVSLLVVILNYRTAGLTIDCLRSLVPEIPTVPGCKVVVVDNDSQDGSAEKIQAAIATSDWGDWASLMPLPHNGGFAAGNNAPIREILKTETPPPYVLLLNPDTVVRPGAIRALVDFMEANPKVGIAGSRLEEPDGTPQRSAFRFPSIFSELEDSLRLGFVSHLLSRWVVAPPVPEADCPTDWVAGASMIIRREVFDAIGLMDEQYFLYFEEVDFCLQANRAGWPCWYVPESRVVHFVGQSSGITNTNCKPKRRPQYWFDSRRRYFVKNHGQVYAAIADITRIIGFSLWHVRRTLQRRPDIDPPKMLIDLISNSVFLKGSQV